MKLQRDQVVAATLVGTVVVVLGFASGIGRVPQTQNAQNAISQPTQHPHTPSPIEQPHQPANHVPQPVAHNPAPVPHLPEGPHVPAPEHPHSTTPPSTTKPPATTPPANEPCDAGAITKLLRQLGLLSLLDEELPVVHELPEGTKKAERLSLVELPLLGDPVELVDGVLDDLLGTTCSLVVDEKTDKVTALLEGR